MDWTIFLPTPTWLIFGTGLLFFAALAYGGRRQRQAGNPRGVMLPRAVYSPDRAGRILYIALYIQRCMEHGLRVRFIRDVDRMPHFRVFRGATGALLHPLSDPKDDRYVIRVQLDAPPWGAKQFEGEVHWKEDINFDKFEKDVELYSPAG